MNMGMGDWKRSGGKRGGEGRWGILAWRRRRGRNCCAFGKGEERVSRGGRGGRREKDGLEGDRGGDCEGDGEPAGLKRC